MKYFISYPKPTGGKAGKGCNKTSTVRVCQASNGYYTIVKTFRYIFGNVQSELDAIDKAKAYRDKMNKGDL